MNNYKLTPWLNRDPEFIKALFWVEISDGENYFTTSSNGEYWGFGEEIKTIGNSYAQMGETYKINVYYKEDKFLISYTDKRTNIPLFDPFICDKANEFSNPKMYLKSFIGNITVKYNNKEETVYGKDIYPDIDSSSTPIYLSENDEVELEVAVDDGNWYGFFEYDCWYKGIHTHARTLEDLQTVTTEQIKIMNETIRNEVKTDNWEQKYQELSDEERQSISQCEYYFSLMDRDLSEYEEKYIADKLYDENVVITENSECVIQHFEPTEEDLKELGGILEQYPNINQIELENIYYYHKTTDPSSIIYFKNIENAKRESEQYDNNLSVSTLLCDMYEKQLELENQLVACSEELVSIYEKEEN